MPPKFTLSKPRSRLPFPKPDLNLGNQCFVLPEESLESMSGLQSRGVDSCSGMPIQTQFSEVLDIPDTSRPNMSCFEPCMLELRHG